MCGLTAQCGSFLTVLHHANGTHTSSPLLRGAVNFVIIAAIAETTKSFSGDLRPDFLARCQPAPPVGSPPGDLANHISNAAVRLGAVHIGEIARCTNPDTGAVREGRFVSTHSLRAYGVGSRYHSWHSAGQVL